MKRLAGAALMMLFVGNVCFAQFPFTAGRSGDAGPVRFETDVDFWYYFDNREFDLSQSYYYPSGTSHSVLVTPYAGLSVRQSASVNHRFMLGLELCRDMGSGLPFEDTFKELLAFYDVHAALPGGNFEAVAGVFPRSFQEAEYTEAIYRGGLKFGDRNFEGCILKYGNGRFYAETGLDWTGMRGQTSRERFQIFTGGRWDATDWLRLGWSGSFFHYAGSVEAEGVVDNHLFNPYVRFNVGKYAGVQELSLKAGAILTYQWDRVQADAVSAPAGAEFVFSLKNWNVRLQNTFYVGGNLQPYYFSNDVLGVPYGGSLYLGNPFYRSLYDMGELSWTPRISDCVGLALIFRVYCGCMPDENGPFGVAGLQQICNLTFDLDKILNPDRVCGRIGKYKERKVRVKAVPGCTL